MKKKCQWKKKRHLIQQQVNMKRFKQFSKDADIKDFEEDVIGETPDTADAMKRHKAGKAGFSDKAHLKAKGLIPRADGTKVKSDKYKQRKRNENF